MAKQLNRLPTFPRKFPGYGRLISGSWPFFEKRQTFYCNGPNFTYTYDETVCVSRRDTGFDQPG
jgi:hypothetical protein